MHTRYTWRAKLASTGVDPALHGPGHRPRRRAHRPAPPSGRGSTSRTGALDAADELAKANGAELISYKEVGNDTEVWVRLRPAGVTGRARGTGDRDAGPTGGPIKALADSGWRSEDQAVLYENRATNPDPVAPSGSSKRERAAVTATPGPTTVSRSSRYEKVSPVAQERRVRLVVRRVEPWTVLKLSLLLFAMVYLVFLIAGLVLWAAATATGIRENTENFIGDLIGSDDVRILGPTMLRASILGGLVVVVMGTGASVLFAVLYNLISDVVGRIAVVFEERPTRRRIIGGRKLLSLDKPVPPLKPARAARRRPTVPGPDTTPIPEPPLVQPDRWNRSR